LVPIGSRIYVSIRGDITAFLPNLMQITINSMYGSVQ